MIKKQAQGTEEVSYEFLHQEMLGSQDTEREPCG